MEPNRPGKSDSAVLATMAAVTYNSLGPGAGKWFCWRKLRAGGRRGAIVTAGDVGLKQPNSQPMTVVEGEKPRDVPVRARAPDARRVIERTRLTHSGTAFAHCCERYIHQFEHLNGWPSDVSSP